MCTQHIRRPPQVSPAPGATAPHIRHSTLAGLFCQQAHPGHLLLSALQPQSVTSPLAHTSTHPCSSRGAAVEEGTCSSMKTVSHPHCSRSAYDTAYSNNHMVAAAQPLLFAAQASGCCTLVTAWAQQDLETHLPPYRLHSPSLPTFHLMPACPYARNPTASLLGPSTLPHLPSPPPDHPLPPSFLPLPLPSTLT